MAIEVLITLLVLMGLLWGIDRQRLKKNVRLGRALIEHLGAETKYLRECLGKECDVMHLPPNAFVIIDTFPNFHMLAVAERPGEAGFFLVNGLLEPARGKCFVGGARKTFKNMGELPATLTLLDDTDDVDEEVPVMQLA